MLSLNESHWTRDRRPSKATEASGRPAPRCSREQKSTCRTDRAQVVIVKSIRHAANEFVVAPKRRRVFISFSYIEQSLDAEFKMLVDKWREDTFFQSSLSEICFHPAYQTIMAMGKEALPLILSDLEKRNDHWFYALKHIARRDAGAGAKNLEAARRLWLEWGRMEKYLL